MADRTISKCMPIGKYAYRYSYPRYPLLNCNTYHRIIDQLPVWLIPMSKSVILKVYIYIWSQANENTELRAKIFFKNELRRFSGIRLLWIAHRSWIYHLGKHNCAINIEWILLTIRYENCWTCTLSLFLEYCPLGSHLLHYYDKKTFWRL